MRADLPVGMVSIGDALQGFLTVLEERCNQPESPGRTVPLRVPYGTPKGRMEGTETRKAPAMLSTSEGVNEL